MVFFSTSLFTFTLICSTVPISAVIPAKESYLSDKVLEVRAGRVQPLQVRVQREVGERLPGGLVAVDVHRVDTQWLMPHCMEGYYQLSWLVWLLVGLWVWFGLFITWRCCDHGYPLHASISELPSILKENNDEGPARLMIRPVYLHFCRTLVRRILTDRRAGPHNAFHSFQSCHNVEFIGFKPSIYLARRWKKAGKVPQPW